MSAVVEQLPFGFRYRVRLGAEVVAASQVFDGLEDALYALQKRFPGMKVDKIDVLS